MSKSSVLSSILNVFRNSKKAIYLIAVLYVALAIYYGKYRTEKVIVWDTIVYYEYLTAAFMFNDLSFEFAKNLPEDFDGEIWLSTGPDGEQFPKTSMGVAIMLTPTYLLAMTFNWLFDLGSYGYSSFFQAFIVLAGIFHFLAGLIFLRKILNRFFEEKVVAYTLIIISLATGLAYYAGLEAGLSHIYSFFLIIFFIWTTIKWHENPNWKTSFALGLTLGMILLVRPVNAFIVLIPALYGITDLHSLRIKLRLIFENYQKVFFSIVIFGAVLSLQFFFWKYATGKWFVYSYGDERFFWTEPKILEGLFGFRKGLFIYTPVLIFAILGFFLREKKIKDLKGPLILFLVVNTYVILSWWCWWYGGGYGHRTFVDSFGIFALFIAVVIDRVLTLKSKVYQYAFFLSVGFFIILNQFQLRQYDRGILHWDGMTYDSYKEIFFKTYTSQEFWDYLEQPDYESAKKGVDR